MADIQRSSRHRQAGVYGQDYRAGLQSRLGSADLFCFLFEDGRRLGPELLQLTVHVFLEEHRLVHKGVFGREEVREIVADGDSVYLLLAGGMPEQNRNIDQFGDVLFLSPGFSLAAYLPEDVFQFWISECRGPQLAAVFVVPPSYAYQPFSQTALSQAFQSAAFHEGRGIFPIVSHGLQHPAVFFQRLSET